jgi:hypothetical protein
MQQNPKIHILTAIEFLRIVPLSEAARLAGLSVRTLRDKFPDKLVKRGQQVGMRVGHALQLPEPTARDG